MHAYTCISALSFVGKMFACLPAFSALAHERSRPSARPCAARVHQRALRRGFFSVDKRRLKGDEEPFTKNNLGSTLALGDGNYIVTIDIVDRISFREHTFSNRLDTTTLQKYTTFFTRHRGFFAEY